MSKIRRAIQRVRTNLLSDKLTVIETKVAEIHHSNGVLHHQVAQIRAKTDPSRTYGAYQMSPTETVTQLFNGLKMVLDPRDIAVAPHIILDGIWEDPITKAWLSLLKPGMTVFDIGANFGYFGLLAAQAVGKEDDARVVLFEANPNLIPYIEKSIAMNWLKERTIVEQAGVSDKKGTAELHILKDYVGSSSLQPVERLDSYLHDVMHVEAASMVKVPTVPIDDYCKGHSVATIDMMKMDIEGFEQKAYAGMKQTVADSPDMVLFVEFTKEGYDNPRAFYEEMVADFGHVYTINPDDGTFIAPPDPDYDQVVGTRHTWVMLVLAKKEL